jgi:hypothetical protein
MREVVVIEKNTRQAIKYIVAIPKKYELIPISLGVVGSKGILDASWIKFAEIGGLVWYRGQWVKLEAQSVF